MYAFLFLLGAVIAAAGLGVVASGVSIQDHTIDATNLMPAMIAVIGGLILIGLSFVVRALQRVERALAARPMPRPARLGEVGGTVLTPQLNEAARIPFPPKPKGALQPQPGLVPAAVRPMPAPSAATHEGSQESVPLLMEESDVSLLPKAPVRADEEIGDVNHGVAARANGAAPVKTAPRFGVSARPSRRPPPLQPKDSIFNTLWPKVSASAPAPAPEANAAPIVQMQPAPLPPTTVQPANGNDSSAQAPAALVQKEASAVVTVLKSGVVEGMAYTLYSDGSIEAQLPAGTVRFGSITELRNHIEKSA
jgi:hypothetical protein